MRQPRSQIAHRRRRPPARLPRRRPAAGPAGRDRPRDAVVAGPDAPDRQPRHPQRPAARRRRRPPAPARRHHGRDAPAARRRWASCGPTSSGSGSGPASTPPSGPGIRVVRLRRRPGDARSPTSSTSCRNAGAEAIARRRCPRRRRHGRGGPPGALSVENTALGPRIEVLAIGNPPALTGALTRAGGIVAQLQATYEEVPRSR